jgi:hypothetical protein
VAGKTARGKPTDINPAWTSNGKAPRSRLAAVCSPKVPVSLQPIDYTAKNLHLADSAAKKQRVDATGRRKTSVSGPRPCTEQRHDSEREQRTTRPRKRETPCRATPALSGAIAAIRGAQLRVRAATGGVRRRLALQRRFFA